MSWIAEFRRRKVLRVAAAYLVGGWLLTEVLTTVLPALGAPDWLPRAVVLIFALGLVPTLVLSWFYELTTVGIRRDTGRRQDGEPQAAGASAGDYLTVGGVVLLTVLVGFLSARHGVEPVIEAPAVRGASVAVLPFDNLSNDDDNEYFSDGLAETLLHMLAQIPDLEVAARTSSFALKGENMTIGQIARTLGVSHVLEGSVQRIKDQIRVNATLVRASDGFQVWSASYDRTLEDIFGIQDEIARKVGFALTESLLGPRDGELAVVQTDSPDAYDLYLQARKQQATYSYGGLRAAEDLLKGALVIDPDFVEAKKELAVGFIRQVKTGLARPSEAFGEALAIIVQVLEAQPADPVARAIFVYVDTMSRILRGEAGSMHQLATELEGIVAEAPGELEPRMLLVQVYESTGQDAEAVGVLEQAVESDPFNPQLQYELGTALLSLERLDDARAALERSLQIEGSQPNAHVNLGLIALRRGDGVAYVRHMLDAVAVDPRDHELPGALAGFLYGLGLIAEGDDFRARVRTIAPTSGILYRIDLLRAIAAGDGEEAEAAARRAIRDSVEPRHFAIAGAVQYLLRSAADTGGVEQEFEWLRANAPVLFPDDEHSIPAAYLTARLCTFDGWYVLLEHDALVSRIDEFIETASGMGFNPQQDASVQLEILALRGDADAAIQVALDEVFSRSVAEHPGWERTFAQAQYRPIIADPRVGSAMAQWEREQTELRKRIADYLAELDAQT